MASTTNPEGRKVELSSAAWEHVCWQHPEMAGYLNETMRTVAQPDHREPDVRPGRERFFARIGPEAWLRVVVEFVSDQDRIITAFPQSNDPRSREGRR